MVTIFRLVWLFFPSVLYAWGANGHVLISHLAYQYMTPKTQIWLHQQLSRSKKPPSASDLSRASIWLDEVRSGPYRGLNRLHYIDLPYGETKFFSKLASKNAVTALVSAEHHLLAGDERIAKIRFYLKLMLHVIADLHQPMHSIDYFSQQYPKGDHGGNLYLIHNRYYRGNLHHFWDGGGGWLTDFSWQDQTALAAKLHEFSTMSCQADDLRLDPFAWAQASFQIAKKNAYFPPVEEQAFLRYQEKARDLTKQQVFKAACHLAAYMNYLSSNTEKLS